MASGGAAYSQPSIRLRWAVKVKIAASAERQSGEDQIIPGCRPAPGTRADREGGEGEREEDAREQIEITVLDDHHADEQAQIEQLVHGEENGRERQRHEHALHPAGDFPEKRASSSMAGLAPVVASGTTGASFRGLVASGSLVSFMADLHAG